MEPTDAAWMAGLFEGEGSFLADNGGKIRVSIAMTDRDVVDRFARLTGANLLGPYRYANGGTRKPSYRVVVNGPRAVALIELIWPYLGERRRARAVELGFEPCTISDVTHDPKPCERTR